ncbi:MAG: hypothetical protein ACK555_08155 [Acidobacteriota bacterium]
MPAILSRRSLLLSSLALASCKRSPTSQRVDPALAPLIPPDSTSLIGLRMDHLQNTPAWSVLFPAQGEVALESLRRETGINLLKGMYEILYCLGGRHRVVLLRGKFVDGGITNSGLEPQLNLPGAHKFPYKGFTFVGREEQAVTFFNSSVAAAGRAAALRSLIDSRELKNAIPIPLLDLVATLPPESYLYLASIAPALPEGGLAGLKSLPLSLSSFKAWVDFRAGAALHAEALGAGAADAQKLLDGLRGLVSLLRLTLKAPEKDLLASLRFSSSGRSVLLDADLPLDALKRSLRSAL